MARLSDLTLRYRLFMKSYRYRSVEWPPGVELTKPLSESRIAVVTTAALYRLDQRPFDEKTTGGDFSFRIIPADSDLQRLAVGHRSTAFDPAGIERDKNLALPLDRLRELELQGSIGNLNRRHFSFMGSITAPNRLISKTAPAVASKLVEDQVDGVLLTPV